MKLCRPVGDSLSDFVEQVWFWVGPVQYGLILALSEGQIKFHNISQEVLSIQNYCIS